MEEFEEAMAKSDAAEQKLLDLLNGEKNENTNKPDKDRA
jgi:hypothetical protein